MWKFLPDKTSFKQTISTVYKPVKVEQLMTAIIPLLTKIHLPNVIKLQTSKLSHNSLALYLLTKRLILLSAYFIHIIKLRLFYYIVDLFDYIAKSSSILNVRMNHHFWQKQISLVCLKQTFW